MRRIWVGLLLICAAAAQAESPEPSREAMARAAQSCNGYGAFGYRFGERNARLGRDSGIAPFRVETLSAHSDGVFEITAVAWFGKAPMSQEDRIALAGWVFRTLDGEAAKRGFAQRDQRPDGVLYRSQAATGYTLDIGHDGVTVWLTCTDTVLKRHAWSAMRENRDSQ